MTTSIEEQISEEQISRADRESARAGILEAKRAAVEAAWPRVDNKLRAICRFSEWMQALAPDTITPVHKWLTFETIRGFSADELEAFIAAEMPRFQKMERGHDDWIRLGSALTYAITRQKLQAAPLQGAPTG